MSTGAIIAVGAVGVMVCCSASSAAAVMMGGDDDKTPGPGPAPAPTGPILPKARYVTLTFHEDTPSKYILSPYEVRVFDKSGTNLALSGSISDVGDHHDESRFPRGAIIDDDETTLWHSKHGASTDFITIDLGADKEIAKIEVLNETITTVFNGVAANARMSGGGPNSSDKGAYVELKNATGSVVKTTPDIKTVATKYTIDFNTTTPTWK
jgi:hypothetical protein